MTRAHILLAASTVALGGCAGGASLGRFDVRPVVPEDYAARGTPLEAGVYELGKRQLAAGNAGLAIDAFRRALRTDPASVEALNGLAVAYDRIRRFDLSRRYYEQALGIDPRSAVALHNFGYSLALQGKAAEGRELLARAAELGDQQVKSKAQHHLASIDNAGAPAVASRTLPVVVSVARQWIERTTASVQTLVTTADPVEVAGSEVAPHLRNVHVVSDAAAPVPPAGSALPSVARAVAEMAVAETKTALAGAATQMPQVPVVVVNGVGRPRMASRLGGYLSDHGIRVAGLGNGWNHKGRHSVIHYAPASRPAAVTIAQLLPFEVALQPADVPAGVVQLVIGRNALRFDDNLIRRQREA